MSRISALDGLRGLAILLVLLWHAVFDQYSPSPVIHKLLVIGKLSWSGVDLFFVLSGFLIGGILLDAKDSPSYYKTFYLRRAFRILPLYLVLLGIYFVIRPTLLGAWMRFQVTEVPALSLFTFTQNFWMALPKYFGGGIGATWSLAIEEQFYLLMPFLVRKLRRTQLIFVLLAAVILAPVLRFGLIRFFPQWGCAPYVLMPCRADALSLGVLCAILVRRPYLYARVLPFVPWGIGILLVPLAWLTHHGHDPFSKSIAILGYSLLALFYACWLLLAAAGGLPFLENRWLRNLGGIAYGTYLLHVPLISLVAHIADQAFLGRPHAGAIAVVLAAVIGVGVTLILASLSWRFFEHPLVIHSHRYGYEA